MKYKVYDRVVSEGFDKGIIVGIVSRNDGFAYKVWFFNDSDFFWQRESELIPDDPHIRKIDGKWLRIYGPLDIEEAKELIGQEVYFGDFLGAFRERERLEGVREGESDVYTYWVGYESYALIAVPMEEEREESKPEIHPIMLDALYTAVDALNAEVEKIRKEEKK
jgi:hypothetical protein